MDASISGQTVASSGGKRGRPRESMFLQAVLRPRGGEDGPAFTVKVRNLSADGMMAQSEQPVGENDLIAVELRNIGRVGGTVAWVKGDRFGILFDKPIDPKLARQKITVRTPAPEISPTGFRKAAHPLG